MNKLLAAVLLTCIAVPALANKELKWTVETTVTTNEVKESEYDKKEEGYAWTKNHRNFPNAHYMWATGFVHSVTNMAYVNYNHYTVGGAPDPFEEKVTVTRYLVVSNDLYWFHLGPFRDKYATRHTVLRRFKTVHKQKINMTESTITVED